MATNTSINANASTPFSALYGGTGVSNTGTWTNTGNVTFAGAFTFTGTVTGNTSVTFPTSGTLATTTQGISWSDVSGTTQAAAVNSAYVISNAAQTTVTLPATAPLGSRVRVQGKGAAGWILAASGAQTIQIGSVATTAGGTVTSQNQWDAIEVVCVTANTTWAMSPPVTSGFTIA